MPVSLEGFSALMELFKTHLPNWRDFFDAAFQSDEIDYKHNAQALAQELLGREQLLGLIERGDWDKFLDRIARVGKSTNLLWMSVPMSGDLSILYVEDLDKPRFCREFFDLIHGTGSSVERFDAYTTFVTSAGLPNKWTFPTYFLFFLHPETEFFVKPSVSSWLLKETAGETLGKASGAAYARVLELVGSLGEHLAPFGATDMIDVQSFVWQSWHSSQQALVSPSIAAEFSALFQEFLDGYVESEDGQWHAEMYTRVREQAKEGVGEVRSAVEGSARTELTLLRLLPYADTPGNRERGAWVSHAPVFAGDIHTKFENAGWASPEDWPAIANGVRALVLGALEDPDQIADLCTGFSESIHSRGLQAGTISPILNALDPEHFVVINSKVVSVLKYLTNLGLNTTLAAYPSTNQIALNVVDSLKDALGAAALHQLSVTDVFDMFCHWMVAVKHFNFKQLQYWKIAPGENAHAWREGSYIGIGWEALGDVSQLSKSEFNSNANVVQREHPDWNKTGMNQVWKFAKHINEGDRVLANRGTSEVLALGTVTGPYYFVGGTEYGHRLPVEWDDLMPRRVTQGGWKRTLIKLDYDTFKKIEEGPTVPAHAAIYSQGVPSPLDRAFKTRDGAIRAFVLLREILSELDIENADDERLALTSPRSGLGVLRLNYLQCVIVSFQQTDTQEPQLLVSLDESLLANTNLARTHETPFLQRDEDDPPIYLYEMELSEFNHLGGLECPAFQSALAYFKTRYENWRKSPLRDRNHIALLARAVFDQTTRDEVMTGSLPIAEPSSSPKPDIDPGCPFTLQTFNLLGGLRNDPTKQYYEEHHEEFRSSLEDPFKQLLQEIASKLPSTMQHTLETEKRITSRILKNDYGKGGAHDYYWGAFYPKGSKRIADAQLFVWLNKDVLDFGFYIGEYASEQRERFLRNAMRQKTLILDRIAPLLAEHDLRFGPRQEFLAGGSSEDQLHKTPVSWLEALDDESIRAGRRLSRDDVLSKSKTELVSMITSLFEAIYPLFILAVSEDPNSEIALFLGEFETPDINPEYPLGTCADDTGFNLEELSRWVRAIERKKQAVIYGPPGTGKTYIAEKLAEHLIGGGDGFTELVQFHPAYAYEDFMQGIRPQTTGDGQLEYPMSPGRFLEFCQRARLCEGRCVLIIDEINRANLARVFGELMYLLEYRDQKVPLAGGGLFSIPPNVRIVGTMNTADRSIALVDHALRRRFAFLALYPNYELLAHFHADTGFDPSGLVQVLKDVNTQIADRHYEVGITFFLNRGIASEIEDVWKMEIEPYLEEYFFDQPDKVKEFEWSRVSERILRA